MKVLFITIAWPKLGEYNIYSDLMQEFVENGHQVTVAVPNEKFNSEKTYLSTEEGIQVLRVTAGTIQKTNKYTKVISSFLAGPKLVYSVNKYLKNSKFDLILFSTPPITLTPSVVWLKRKYKAKMYLLLKDIWPQDAVDLGEITKNSPVWKVFRFLEIITYKNSDYIGCMSPANVEFIKKNNKFLNEKIIEVCPNSLKNRELKSVDKDLLRRKYNLPLNKVIFIYGGNLGKAQGVEFLIEMIKEYKGNSDIYFLIVGSGTEYNFLYKEINNINAKNAKILPSIPRNKYEDLVRACDVGLILLQKNSTVPNFPSRLLSYLIAKIPIITAVDHATDIGHIIEQSGCGINAYNGDIESFKSAVSQIMVSSETRKLMGENGYNLFLKEYLTKNSYEKIIGHF